MERRKLDRRDFSYYMRVLEASTDELVGYLSDISTTGFKLDSQKPLRLNQDYRLKIELTSEIADKTALIFLARSKWCRPDYVDPSTYNVGFEIVNMSSGDLEIFTRMFEKYGSRSGSKKSDDYLWR